MSFVPSMNRHRTIFIKYLLHFMYYACCCWLFVFPHFVFIGVFVFGFFTYMHFANIHQSIYGGRSGLHTRSHFLFLYAICVTHGHIYARKCISFCWNQNLQWILCNFILLHFFVPLFTSGDVNYFTVICCLRTSLHFATELDLCLICALTFSPFM